MLRLFRSPVMINLTKNLKRLCKMQELLAKARNLTTSFLQLIRHILVIPKNTFRLVVRPKSFLSTASGCPWNVNSLKISQDCSCNRRVAFALLTVRGRTPIWVLLRYRAFTYVFVSKCSCSTKFEIIMLQFLYVRDTSAA